MAPDTEQQNKTRRRAEIMDADYVPREAAPNTPRVSTAERKSRSGSPAAAAAVFIAFLALAMAVSRDDSARRAAQGETPVLTGSEARWQLPAAEAEDVFGDEKLLGAAVETMTGPVAAYYSMKDCPQVPGVQVCSLEPGGAAAAAGLVPGDVITAADGKEIRTAEELSETLRACKRGEATLAVYRLGETLEVTVRLDTEENTSG